ncbi:hypothetical protein [Fischerella sp. PCC 9605]|uniref:hypothetical protein n=1 Tax=Fischerella sp. PCC 9605 TaxID=1173024 RepID=UPI0004792E92|nr:hypothetical protein [Fischerella sp. PCC 9605]
MVLAPFTIETHQSSYPEGFGLFHSANVAYIEFARWLKQQQESMKPKAFKQLLASYGMIRREATKFIKLATVSDRFVPEDLAKVGLMMFSLLTPRYEPLWSEMMDEGQLTQDLIDGLKKQMFPAKKREKKPESITSAIDNQEHAARLERIVSREGISPLKAVDKALDYYEAFAEGRLVWAEVKDLEQADVVPVSEASPGANSPITPEENSASLPTLEVPSQAQEASAQTVSESSFVEDSASLPILEIPSVAEVADVNESLQEARAQQANVSQDSLSLATTSQSEAGVSSVGTVQAAIPPEVSYQSSTTNLQSPIPKPTERWKEGWHQGDIVVANSVRNDRFSSWSKGHASLLSKKGEALHSTRKGCCATTSINQGACELSKKASPFLDTLNPRQPLQITAVSGRVGSVQRITVIDSDFQEHSTFGNWIEPAPQYQVTGTDGDWEGKVVRINSIGKMHHRISAVDDESCSTNIKHEFLVPVVDEGCKQINVVSEKEQNQPIAITRVEPLKLEQDELEQFITAEEVAQGQWGLSLGDTVVWSDREREEMMSGHIYDFTPDVALVDCGQQKPVAVAYPHIKKITPQLIESALSDDKSPHSQILQKALSIKALWNENSIGALAHLNELLNMSWQLKVWLDIDAMSEENRLVFIRGGKDYLEVGSRDLSLPNSDFRIPTSGDV